MLKHYSIHLFVLILFGSIFNIFYISLIFSIYLSCNLQRVTVHFFLSHLDFFYLFFSYLIAVASIFNNVEYALQEWASLIPSCSQRANFVFHHLEWCYLWVCYVWLFMLAYVTLYTYCVQSFYHKQRLNVVKHFSASIKMIV